MPIAGADDPVPPPPPPPPPPPQPARKLAPFIHEIDVIEETFFCRKLL